MSYILSHYEPDGNGVRDIETEVAISEDREVLVKYTKTEFDYNIGQDTNKDKPFWSGYYLIHESSMKIM